jgi:cyclic beta-1,2-glucan synthetase
VIAADIYGADPHVGRGGWTWYTGSAGWMYRVALESVLGFTLQGGDTIRIKPVIPSSWPGFTIRYRLPDGATVYEISVVNDAVGASPQASSATLDGKAVALEGGAALVPLRADRGLHHVEIVLRSL